MTLERQPHGGALHRGGLKQGSRNRPKPAIERVRKACERKASGAVRRLWEVIQDPATPPSVTVKGCALILAYAVGKPRQSVEVAHSGGLEEGALIEALGLNYTDADPDRREAAAAEG